MKRIHKSEEAPAALREYIACHPVGDAGHTWGAFCDSCGKGKREVQKQIRDDQRNLCAYYEIEMQESSSSASVDSTEESYVSSNGKRKRRRISELSISIPKVIIPDQSRTGNWIGKIYWDAVVGEMKSWLFRVVPVFHRVNEIIIATVSSEIKFLME